METLTIKITDRDEEAAIWPEATPDERLNQSAMMMLRDNLTDDNDWFFVFWTADYATGTITYRSEQRPLAITRLRHALSEIPEIDFIRVTI